MENPNIDLRIKLEMIEVLQDLLGEEQKEAATRVIEIRDDILRQAMASAGLNVPADFTVPEEVTSFRQMLSGETDRGCALACAAYLQSSLADLLKAYMVDETVTADLLEGSGSLATFYAQINASYALGLISSASRRDLNIIRWIRNEFAHEPKEISFEYDPIASRCSGLYHDLFREQLPPRKKYVRVTMGVLAELHGAKHHVQHRDVARDVDLDSPEFKKFATEFPKNLRAALGDRLGSSEAFKD